MKSYLRRTVPLPAPIPAWMDNTYHRTVMQAPHQAGIVPWHTVEWAFLLVYLHETWQTVTIAVAQTHVLCQEIKFELHKCCHAEGIIELLSNGIYFRCSNQNRHESKVIKFESELYQKYSTTTKHKQCRHFWQLKPGWPYFRSSPVERHFRSLRLVAQNWTIDHWITHSFTHPLNSVILLRHKNTPWLGKCHAYNNTQNNTVMLNLLSTQWYYLSLIQTSMV